MPPVKLTRLLRFTIILQLPLVDVIQHGHQRPRASDCSGKPGAGEKRRSLATESAVGLPRPPILLGEPSPSFSPCTTNHPSGRVCGCRAIGNTADGLLQVTAAATAQYFPVQIDPMAQASVVSQLACRNPNGCPAPCIGVRPSPNNSRGSL